MSPTILMMAGGTGGHLFPALAVAQQLVTEGYKVHWLGSQGGMERELIPQYGFPIEYLQIGGLRGKGLVRWLTTPLQLVRSVIKAVSILRKLQPVLVVGMGGFVAAPGGIAAWLTRRPLLIHEQNAIPGLTNRMLARLANQVAEAFPNAFFRRKGVVTTGNPMLKGFRDCPEVGVRYQHRSGRLRILVVGGSRGAAALNDIVPAAVANLDSDIRPEIVHQCGKGHLTTTEKLYRDLGVRATVNEFMEDMANAYADADLVICRAGAMTIAEIAAIGVASILVPFPYAVDDHQTANAKFLVDAGAAWLAPQQSLTSKSLSERLLTLCANSDKGRIELEGVALNAKQLAQPQATEEVVRLCRNLIEESGYAA